MADVFISYAREDRAQIETLAALLEADGRSVWWDRRIDAGAEFTRDIERELRAAKVAIVAWSAAGAASPWVRDEASLARDLKTLLPIQLDAGAPPLGFQQFHTFDFSGWRGDAAGAEFATLRSLIARRLGADSAPIFPPASGAMGGALAQLRLRPRVALGAAGAAIAVAAGLLFVLLEPSGPPIEAAPRADTGAPSLAKVPAAVKEATVRERVGLAVLPFTNLSSDPDQEHFADGLTEELLNWLGNVEGLNVPGRTSSFQFKGKADDLRAIGERLSVEYLLEGSVRRSGDALRITAQLIEAKTGYHLWSETYDRQIADIFAIQDDVARVVVTELLGKLPQSGVLNPAAVGDVDPRAHEVYLEGRALLTRRQWPAAFEKFRAAVDLDPRHALAQAYLAVAAAQMTAAGAGLEGPTGRTDRFDEVASAALAQAVNLQPQSADVLFATGWVAEMRSGAELGGPIADPAIIDFYQRAVRANPRHVEALHALVRGQGNSPERRIELYERVLAIDPAHRSAQQNLLKQYSETGARSKASSLARQWLASGPDARAGSAEAARAIGDMALLGEAVFADWEATESDPYARYIRASVLASLGAAEEARFLFEREAKSAQRPWRQLALASAAVLAGDAERELKAAQDMHQTGHPPPFSNWALALAQIGAGDPANAYKTLLESRPELADPARSTPIGPELGDPGYNELVTAAHALGLIGRRDEARALWSAALPPVKTAPTWTAHLQLSLIHGHLGDKAAAVRDFKTAYELGFRFLWSYDCDACAHNGFFSGNGLFAEHMKIPEFARLVEKIEAENRATLEAFNRKYRVLDRVRALMAADKAAGAERQ